MHIQRITNQLDFRSVYDSKSPYAENGLEPEKDTKQTPKNKRIGSAITVATIASVCGVLMLSRRSQKSTEKYLTKFKNYIESKQEISAINESSKLTKFYEHIIRRTNSFLKKSESINNITSLKDILFMRLMYKTELTKNIHKTISDFFEGMSRKTVIDSYKKTKKDFERMNKICEKLDEFILKNSADEIVEIDGKKYTKKELVEKARYHRSIANTVVETVMSEDALKYRYDYINDVTSSLYSEFWNASFKDFWSKNNKFKRKEMWQTFIAAEQIQGDKTRLAENIAIARNSLSYTKQDRLELVYEYIKKLDGLMPESDKEGIEIIKKLEWFAKQPEGVKENKSLLMSQWAKLKEHTITTSDKNLAKIHEEWKDTYLNIIKDLLEDTGTGEIQDMLSIYYKIAPFELSQSGASLAIKKAVQSFDKSVNYEIVEFFDKVRDIRLGSAPTDVLTLLFSCVALTTGLGYAKNKDKRTSIMLKSGIPIIGGVAATMFTATKMVSGGKSLAFGLLSGIVLNQIGNIADGMRKLNTKKQQQI